MNTPASMVPLAEAAHVLGVSWSQAWRLVLQHKLEGEKVGGRWMVRVADLEAFVARAASA